MRTHAHAIPAVLAAVAMLATGPARAAPVDDIRATLRQFVAAQNAHDVKRLDGLLSDSRDFLWIGPGFVVRTRQAALDRFAELFGNGLRVAPDWRTLQIVMLDVSTAEIFVRATITADARSQSTDINEVVAHTPHGWRVMTIVMRAPRNARSS
jgi:ketosteroid isomerase-like protein